MIPKNFLIDQRYRVEKNLGGGLSGEVFLVSDQSGLKALKFLKKVQLNVSREEALKSFKNEFSILKELNHPNIARILDFGYDEKMRKYYFTSEYVAGGELQDVCKNKTLDQKEKVFVQILRALNYLHSRGIFHFDIKPQNILVSENKNGDLEAKVIDFGLAGIDSNGKKVGTPIYMAPEMIQGGHLDSRTDLYSTAAMIYTLFVGESPFSGSSYKEIAQKQLELIPQPITQLYAEVPEYWEHILARMLEKDPNQRYSQASLVIRDLNFLSGKKFAIETKDTKLSYLPEKGTLIAREKQWNVFQDAFHKAFIEPQNSNEKLFIVAGDKGTGKTRLLSEIKYYSQLKNVPVKTLAQYQNEEKSSNPFLLQIDDANFTLNEINAVLSEVMQKQCLVVWAIEKAPKNLSAAIVVNLQNYNKTELKTYLESVTGLDHAPKDLIEEIYKRTQGNPFFVTEFIKSLLDQNLFYDESGKWDVKHFEDIKIDFETIKISSSIEEVLKNQFSNLSKNQKEILEWISVNESPLSGSDLKNLMQEKFDEKDLIFLIQNDFLKFKNYEKQYRLKNVVLQNVVISLMTTSKKDHCHANLAKIFQGDSGNYTKYLFHSSFSKNFKDAKESLKKLSEIYLADTNYDKAIHFFSRHVELSKTSFQKDDFSVFMNLGKLYALNRQYDCAKDVYQELLLQIEKQNTVSHDEKMKIYIKLIDIHNKQNLIDDVKDYCDLAEKFISQTNDAKTYELILKNYRAHLKYKAGFVDEAMMAFQQTRQIWKNELSDQQKVMVMNNRLSDIYWIKSEFDKAINFCIENIQVLRESEYKYSLALNYYQLGDYLYRKSFLVEGKDHLNFAQKYLDESSENFKMCEAISKEIYHYNLLLRAYHGLGNVFYTQKNYEAALDYYKRSLSIAQKVDETESAANTAFNIANIYISEKNFKDSYSYLIYAINTFDNLPKRASQSEVTLYLCYLSLAEVYCSLDEYKKAHEALASAEKIFEKNQNMKSYEYWMVIRKALLFYYQSDSVNSQKYYEKAKSLAKTSEEKSDLEQASKILNPSTTDHKMAEKEVRKMSENNANSNSNTHDLDKIIEINQIINSEYNFAQLLKIVLNYAVRLTQAEGGAVLLLDENDDLDVVESTNFSDKEQSQISHSIAFKAISTKEIIESSDAMEDERFDGSQSIVINDLKSVLCLPISSKNRPVGVFYLDNRHMKNAFQNSNVMLLKAFCDQVGIALENAKLISNLRSAEEQLKDDLTRTKEKLDEVKEILHEETSQYKTDFGKSIISKSKAMHDIFRVLDKIKTANLSIFVYGESGTGKELIAKALHYNHPERSQKKFVAVNCGAIPSNLIESELFGHKQGSFTGAIRDKKGMFEEANGGTLFLDEIGELPLELQVKLLRVLQEGEVQRIGDSQTIKVDVRVISASHQDIKKMLTERKFREDLFYRLCQMRIDLPALRERKEDIPELIKHFIHKYAKENNLETIPIASTAFMKAMMNYEWPGNIRELENLISVACALKEGNQLLLDNLPDHYTLKHAALNVAQGFAGQNTSMSLPINSSDEVQNISHLILEGQNYFRPQLTWKEYEALIVAKAYQAAGWNKKTAADYLGVSHSTVYKKLDDYNLHDRNHALYKEDFVYNLELTLKDYVEKVFLTSLKFHEDHPYAAIKVLGVSQGYFYKIIKDKRHLVQEDMQTRP